MLAAAARAPRDIAAGDGAGDADADGDGGRGERWGVGILERRIYVGELWVMVRWFGSVLEELERRGMSLNLSG